MKCPSSWRAVFASALPIKRSLVSSLRVGQTANAQTGMCFDPDASRAVFPHNRVSANFSRATFRIKVQIQVSPVSASYGDDQSDPRFHCERVQLPSNQDEQFRAGGVI